VSTPKKTLWAAVLGLVVLGTAAFLLVWRLQSQAMDEALTEQIHGLERHWGRLIQRFAAEAFGDGTGAMGRFGERLVTAARSNPAILDLVVVSPERRVVQKFSRDGGDRETPCFNPAVQRPGIDREHAGGTVAEGKVGCLRIPIVVAGEHQGAVYMHTLRGGFDAGARAGRVVRRTAMRLAPVFIAFYVLLGVLLVAASRSARRWRLRAASAERVEALGALADGINHEIRNPLNAVSLSLQYLGRKYTDKETREVVDSGRRQARRIGETLDEFARFMRVHKLSLRAISVGERLRHAAGEAPRAVEVTGEARAEADVDKLDDAFRAIVGLMEAQAQKDAPITMHIEERGGRWHVVARCDAPELDADRVERLFDPFVRHRPRDVGRGLGIARAVFQAHGGDLTATLKSKTLTVRGSAPLNPTRVTGDR